MQQILRMTVYILCKQGYMLSEQYYPGIVEGGIRRNEWAWYGSERQVNSETWQTLGFQIKFSPDTTKSARILLDVCCFGFC